MKKSNMVLIVGAALLMATATGCSGNKEAKSDNKAQTEVADADIRGQWYIENYYCPLNHKIVSPTS